MREVKGERRYGCWAGNPEGVAEDKARCIEQVYNGDYGGIRFRQCFRTRGHGKDGLYCKQHAKKNPA